MMGGMVSSASAEVTKFTHDVHAQPTLRVVRACHPASHSEETVLYQYDANQQVVGGMASHGDPEAANAKQPGKEDSGSSTESKSVKREHISRCTKVMSK